MGTGNAAAILERPRCAVKAALRDSLHQRVPRRMKLDPIDAFAAYVEVLQHRREAIGEVPIGKALGRAEERAGARELLGVRGGALAPYRLLQRRIAAEQVVVLQRRRLIRVHPCILR